MHNILQDLHRHKVLSKIKNDGYYFIERAVIDKRILKKMKKTGGIERLDSTVVNSKLAEQLTRKHEKLERNLIKKLYHLNITRMLSILQYSPS